MISQLVLIVMTGALAAGAIGVPGLLGHVPGLKARGGLDDTNRWKDGEATAAMVTPSQLGRLTFRSPRGQAIAQVRDSHGQDMAEREKTDRVIVETRPGRTDEVSFGPAR